MNLNINEIKIIIMKLFSFIETKENMKENKIMGKSFQRKIILRGKPDHGKTSWETITPYRYKLLTLNSPQRRPFTEVSRRDQT